MFGHGRGGAAWTRKNEEMLRRRAQALPVVHSAIEAGGPAPVRRRALGHDVRSVHRSADVSVASLNRLFIHPKTRSLIRASLRDTMAPEDVLNGALN
jgi:hypothetical protein